MASRPPAPSRTRTRVPADDLVDRATFDAFAAPSRRSRASSDVAAPLRRRDVQADVPVDARSEARTRTRRGGPRTPVPLLPIIALVAGVGIAYVSQTAHLTTSTYQATQLAAEQSDLQQQDTRLSDELDRLRSSARIEAAAQKLGMQPPASWAYVPASQTRVTVPGAPGNGASQPPQDPVQKLVALLSGEFGPTEAEAASP